MRSDVIVVGAGVLGLATAAELRRRGREVVILAPNEVSASALAAGMIAPAFECVLDSLTADGASLLKRARGLWPDFADQTGIQIHMDGAEWRGVDPDGMVERLQAVGFRAERRGAVAFTPEDGRLDPEQALAALGRGLDRVTGRLAGLEGHDGNWRLTTDTGIVLGARQVVLATGWVALDCGIAMPSIRPIRGQAVRVSGPVPQRVVRAQGVYIAPLGDGAVIGATMDEGRSDTVPEAEVTERLLARARAICPELSDARVVRAYAGVRGASPDGWPYAGVLEPGLALALAPRRNGWLLAPMVAGLVADALEVRDPGEVASLMSPGRFA